MNRALLFRRRLTAAGICVLCILFLAFYFALRSAAQSEEMNHWVVHTQEVLGAISQARLERAWLENESWGYRVTRDPRLQRQFHDDRRSFEEAIKHLQELTADNPAQQKLLAKLVPPLSIFVTSLEEAMQQSAAANTKEPGVPAAPVTFEPVSILIRQYFDNLESNEQTLLTSRSEAVRVNARRTRFIVLLAGVLSFSILIVAGHLTQREIMMRERVENGLHTAQELLREKAAALGVSEDALRSQYDILRSVLDSMSEGVVVADKEGRFTLFNPAAEQILGAGRADVPPAEWSQYYQVYQQDQTTLFPSEDLPLVRALRGESTENVQMCVRDRHRSAPSCINVSGRPLKSPDGRVNGGLVVFHDVTEILEANRELEAFNYSVSHDLRAPLRHMQGFSRILQKDYASQLSADAQHYLDRIQSAATHMSSLVEDLLHLSRIGQQVPQSKTVPLGSLAEEIRADLMQEAEGREIDWKILPLPEVHGDAVLLRQVLLNLVSNAVKFTRQQKRAVIEIGSQEENGETVIFVRDNGAGFDPRYADKLFGVFQRLHRQDEFEGTGIGLAIVQRIIHKHGGRVWADSQPGRGAAFYFTLQAYAKTRAPEREMAGANA